MLTESTPRPDSVYESIGPSVCGSVYHALETTLLDGLETSGRRVYR